MLLFDEQFHQRKRIAARMAAHTDTKTSRICGGVVTLKFFRAQPDFFFFPNSRSSGTSAATMKPGIVASKTQTKKC